MGPPELLIVAVIAVAVLFGAKKIPEIARSVGRAQGEFKKGIKEGHVDEEASESSAAPPPAAPSESADSSGDSETKA
jgi:sec-independent protein translocase protein TatA